MKGRRWICKKFSHNPSEFIVMLSNSWNCINISNDFARFFLSHLWLQRWKISLTKSDNLYRTARFLSYDDCVPKRTRDTLEHNNTFSSLNCQLGMFLSSSFFHFYSALERIVMREKFNESFNIFRDISMIY